MNRLSGLRILSCLVMWVGLVSAGGCNEGHAAGGLSYLRADGTSPVYDDTLGGRLAVGGQRGFGDAGNGPQVGARLATSGSFRGSVAGRSVGGQTDVRITENSTLFLINPQATASWRLASGEGVGGGYFVEPGIGAGPTAGRLTYPQSPGGSRTTESDLGFAVNPFLRIGYWNDTYAAGVEAGWHAHRLDFGPAGRDPQEFYAAFFVGLRF